MQTFTDYEVIVTDDSPGNEIYHWLQNQFPHLPITYHHNQPALGTPANWNKAIALANGEWIKLMHDDDWLNTPNAFDTWAKAINRHKKSLLFYSAYENYYLDENRQELVFSPWFRRQVVNRASHALYARNIIGPPSVLLVHRSLRHLYDVRMKWLVDIDYYIRLMEENKMVYLPVPLVAVGVSEEQVTRSCHIVPEVEIPEGLLMYENMKDKKPWRHILYFDAWWRLMRNLHMRSADAVAEYLPANTSIPSFLLRILKAQAGLNAARLQNGYYSKWKMATCWWRQLVAPK
jgi:glycosyltransferase involved in cell wall biosynthesis